MRLARCLLPSSSRLLLHSGSSRGRDICVGGGPLPATCLMGGGRGFFGVSAKVCAAPQGLNPCPFRPIAPLAATEPGRCQALRRDYGRRTLDWQPRIDQVHGGRHRGRRRSRLRPRCRPPAPLAAPREECAESAPSAPSPRRPCV